MKYRHLNEISKYFKPVDYFEEIDSDSMEEKMIQDDQHRTVQEIIAAMDDGQKFTMCIHMRSGTTAELRTLRLNNSYITDSSSSSDKFGYVMMNAFITLFRYIKNSYSPERQNLKYNPEVFFIKVKMKDDSERNINLLSLNNDKINSIKNIFWFGQCCFRIDDLSAEILERSIHMNICFYYMDDNNTLTYFMNLYKQYMYLKQSKQSEKAEDYADYPTVQTVLNAIKSYKAKYNVTDEEILQQYFGDDNKDIKQYSIKQHSTDSDTAQLWSRLVEEIVKASIDKDLLSSEIKTLKESMEGAFYIPITLTCEYKIYTENTRKAVNITEFTV